MSPQKKLAIRLAAYLGLVLYTLLDLFVFSGPLKRSLEGDPKDSAVYAATEKAGGEVARVYGQPIFLTQVLERVKAYLWEQGREGEEISPAEQKMIRQMVLRDLIDERLVRVQIKMAPKEKYVVSDEEVAAAVARFKARYEDEGALSEALLRQGWAGELELGYRLAARLQQQKFFETEVGREVIVHDEEVRAWYEANKAVLALPERRQVRHIFLASLTREDAEGQQLIEETRKRLVEGQEDFAVVAKEVSEDLKTKENGGSLGWVSRDRLPGDFAVEVFALEPKQLSLVRSKLGWHLVEVLESQPSREQTFEEVQVEVKEALLTDLRENKIEGYRELLRRWAGDNVKVFAQPLNQGLE